MTDFDDLAPAPVPTGRSIIRFKPGVDTAGIIDANETAAFVRLMKGENDK